MLRDDSPESHDTSAEKDKEYKLQRINDNNQETELNDDNDSFGKSHKEVNNIDDVFIRITSIYTQEIYNIIYNTLITMGNDDTGFYTYIDGLNKLLEPTNRRIKKWIDENIVF